MSSQPIAIPSTKVTNINSSLPPIAGSVDDDDGSMVNLVSLVDYLLQNKDTLDTTSPHEAPTVPVPIKKARTPPLKKKWKRAIKKSMSMDDPWMEFHLEDFPTERAKRHRYHSTKQTWVIDEVQIKMAKEVSDLYDDFFTCGCCIHRYTGRYQTLYIPLCNGVISQVEIFGFCRTHTQKQVMPQQSLCTVLCFTNYMFIFTFRFQ